jgi:hypothetical protein
MNHITRLKQVNEHGKEWIQYFELLQPEPELKDIPTKRFLIYLGIVLVLLLVAGKAVIL